MEAGGEGFEFDAVQRHCTRPRQFLSLSLSLSTPQGIEIGLEANSPPCAVFFQDIVYLSPKLWLTKILLLGVSRCRTHPALMSKVMTNSAAIGGSSRAMRQLVLARSTCKLPFSLMAEGGEKGGEVGERYAVGDL